MSAKSERDPFPPLSPDGPVVTAAEVAREARRVLRRLAEPEARLKLLESGEGGVFVKRNRFARPVLQVAGAVVREFVAQGLLKTAGNDVFVISAEGRRSCLRRDAGVDGFLAQHREIVRGPAEVGSSGDGKTRDRTVAVNVAESPLSWLARRKDADGAPLITAAQFAAGERLREDYTRGRLMPRVTVDWTQPMTGKDIGGRESLSDSAMAARRRVNKALMAVGPDLADILVEVCCHLRGLEETERTRRWPPRTGKVVVRIALERLAEFYGFARRARSGGIRSWAAGDGML